MVQHCPGKCKYVRLFYFCTYISACLIAGVPEVPTDDGMPLLRVEDENVVHVGVHFSSVICS